MHCFTNVAYTGHHDMPLACCGKPSPWPLSAPVYMSILEQSEKQSKTTPGSSQTFPATCSTEKTHSLPQRNTPLRDSSRNVQSIRSVNHRRRTTGGVQTGGTWKASSRHWKRCERRSRHDVEAGSSATCRAPSRCESASFRVAVGGSS
jgi:hypothetical protein